jgi:hypothetical protein
MLRKPDSFDADITRCLPLIEMHDFVLYFSESEPSSTVQTEAVLLLYNELCFHADLLLQCTIKLLLLMSIGLSK